ncbi:hypothetical protein HDE_13494 [Halotydeus destructor]|nr:hypothetical protein HDE_13494 [Halotydeus destructor]
MMSTSVDAIKIETTHVSTEGNTTISRNLSSTRSTSSPTYLDDSSPLAKERNVSCDERSDDSFSELSTSMFDEPRTKKRRKQSNPTRYGNNQDSEGTSLALLAEQPEIESLMARQFAGLDSRARSDKGHGHHGGSGGGAAKEGSSLHYACPHCPAAFGDEQQLKGHIEDEHVQKILERQLMHQQLQSKANGSAMRQGLDLTMMLKRRPQSGDDSSRSSISGSDSCSSSPQPQSHSEAGLSGPQQVVQELGNMLPFHLRNMPPLMAGLGQEGKAGLPMSMFPNPMASLLFPGLPGQPGQGNHQNSAMQANEAGSIMPGPGFRIFNPEAYCELCNKEFCNKYFLKTHKANKHGIYTMDTPVTNSGSNSNGGHNGYATTPTSIAAAAASFFPAGLTGGHGLNANQPNSATQQIQQLLCDKEFGNMYPFLKAHQSSSISMPMDSPPTPPKPHSLPVSPATSDQLSGQRKESKSHKSRPPSMSTPTKVSVIPPPPPPPPTMPMTANGPDGKPRLVTGRNYCNICNKELCNKYFMKTHMLKMHGINTDDHPGDSSVTSTIGGVTCDICQKELCSKYFLKVHKQNTHGIYEDSSGQSKENRGGSSLSNMSGGPADQHHGHTGDRDLTIPSKGLDPNDTNNRYFSHYTEVCTLCERRFKSIKWLKTHMINDHSDVVPVPTTLSPITHDDGPAQRREPMEASAASDDREVTSPAKASDSTDETSTRSRHASHPNNDPSPLFERRHSKSIKWPNKQPKLSTNHNDQGSNSALLGPSPPDASALPMAYAMPQNLPSAGSFIMQPFLISQLPNNDPAMKNSNFVPCFAYLPVSQKILQPVTVAFQLTPA